MKTKKATSTTERAICHLDGHRLEVITDGCTTWSMRNAMRHPAGKPQEGGFGGNGRTHYRGLASSALRVLGAAGVAYELIDERPEFPSIKFRYLGKPDRAAKVISWEPYSIMAHHDDDVRIRLAIETIAIRKIETLVVVKNKARMDTWLERLGKLISLPGNEKPGQIYGAWQKHRFGAITVAAWAALERRLGLDSVPPVGLLIVDECDSLLPNRNVWDLLKISCRYSLGLSGGEFPTVHIGNAVQAVIGPVLFDFFPEGKRNGG